MITVKPMRDFLPNVRNEVAKVFIEAYYDELAHITKDKNKLLKVFTQAINQEVFYVALTEQEVVGILACSTNDDRGLKLDKSTFRETFGFIKGNIAYNFLNSDFNRQLTYPPSTGYIECVGTLTNYRGRGIASKLIEYVTKELHFDEYVLEVSDTNKNAYRLYEKLGFKVFKKVKVKWAKMKGYNETIFMKLQGQGPHNNNIA